MRFVQMVAVAVAMTGCGMLDGVEVELRPSRVEAKVGQPVWLRVNAHNTGTIPFDAGGCGARPVATADSGDVRDVIGTPAGCVQTPPLKPGERTMGELEWVPSQPGEYDVRGEFAGYESDAVRVSVH